MDDRIFRVLELDKILEVLARLTMTTAGREECRNLRPSTDLELIERNLRETGEACHWLNENIRLPLEPLTELKRPEPRVEMLRIDRRVADPPTLMRLVDIAKCSRRCQNALSPLKSALPTVWERMGGLADLEPLWVRIEGAIDRDTLEIRDEASVELSRLRGKYQTIKKRVQRTLDGLLQNNDIRKLLQEPIITLRNGRAVVPVRAELKQRFSGIVHGSSTSGATLFMEPRATIEMNNELASLTSRIEDECLRILRELTAFARTYRRELAETVDVLSWIDRIEAKGNLSILMDGRKPVLNAHGELRLVEARHPLLIPEVSHKAHPEAAPSDSAPVPLSLSVDQTRRVLVLTGPNTGGKTVALKTVGLLALMLQTGLHVPADAASRFPVFRTIFADIGDDQSISSSLSTFSAHLQTIISIEKQLELPGLVILDEVGTGTDPGEGGALGTALVEHFGNRGALVLASTHHQLLKGFATSTEGVQAASFDFDPKTYAPTYRLIEGAAGRSLAFEMALRLGLQRTIVERARALQSEGERQLEELSLHLEQESTAVERERLRLEKTLEELKLEKQKLGALRQTEKERFEKRFIAFQDRLEKDYREAQVELRARLATAVERLEYKSLSRKEIQQIAGSADRDLSESHKRRVIDLAHAEGLGDNAARPRVEPTAELSAGDFVITPLGVTGTLAQIRGVQADVVVGDKKIRVPVHALERASRPTEESTPIKGRKGRNKRSPSPRTVPNDRVQTTLAANDRVTELNVIGFTVEEALAKADKFLDDAIMSDFDQVRVVHGHGTGRLRKALRGFLQAHPHVASLQNEAHDGATLVILND